MMMIMYHAIVFFLYKYEVNGLLKINVIQKNYHALQHDKKYKPVVSITNNYSCYSYLKLKLLKTIFSH